MSGGSIEVTAPDRAGTRSIAPILARAFLDDPIWTAVGPRNRRHRALTNRASFWAILNACRRHGARIRIARLAGAAGSGGRTLGATIAFEPGHWPPPERAALWELGWAALAGPLPVSRGFRAERALREAHVDYPHVYLWFIGVEPADHGRGAGRALMAELHERSDQLGQPTYLESSARDNVSFYASFGYEVVGELAMPAGATMWRMERPPGG